MKLRVSLFAFVFLVAALPAFASSTGVVISAFDTRGANGASDEFVEIHNTSASSVSIAGWKLQGCANGTPGNVSDRVVVPAGVTLSPGQYYLFFNSTAGAYSGATPGDLGYTTGFSDFTTASFAGIRLFNGTSTEDQVGADPNSPCRETTGLATPTTNGASNIFVRKASGTQDTDNNANDFTGPQGYTPHNYPGSALPTISINNVSLNEGDAGTTTFTFTVHLSAVSASAVTFDIATADGTATAASGDYVAKTLTAQSIPAGSQDYAFDVSVNGDTTFEASENFFVNVTNIAGATASGAVQGTGTILNDDASPLPTLSIDSVGHNEGNSGTTTYTFTVTLSAASATDVTFDVKTTDNTATAPSDYTSIPTTSQTITAGQTTKTIDVLVNGDTAYEPNETFYVDISNPSNATIAASRGTGTITNDDVLRIHDVQGSVVGTTPGNANSTASNGCAPTNGADDVSPMCGQTVTLEAIVTSSMLGTNVKGFFLQEADADADADPNTSEGIFVFCNAAAATCAGLSIAEGNRVRVTGTVQEFFGMTELSVTPANMLVTDAGNNLASVTPVTVTLPITGNVNSFYESVESMLVHYNTLTVSEYFQLYRYGQVVLVGGLANDALMSTVPDGRPRTFTEDHTPDATNYANHVAELARSQVILDDDRDGDEAQLTLPAQHQYVYWPHTNGGFSLGTQGADFFRGGDQVQDLVGVVQWARPGSSGSPPNTWRIRPSASYPVTFTPINARPSTPPDVGGSIRAVGMNLLNYFTTIDTTASSSTGPCGPDHTQDCRGADSQAEVDRQTARATKVICSLNPDVAAFMELENNNDDPAGNPGSPNYTINHLLTAVNASCGGAHPYDFVAITDNPSEGTLGTDAIRVMQIYRTGVLAPHGAPLYDSNVIHNRPPTAQAYDVVDSTSPAFGQRFVVVANHLKSKGSCPAAGDPDADQLDGQGCWASRRTQQANATMDWINNTVVPAAGSNNVLLLGDFNSYAHETPVTTLEAGGYHDMETELHGTSSYSYLFSGELGHLDYAFANNAFKPAITGADAWHINADESDLLDYNDTVYDSPGEATFEAKPDGSALAPPRLFWDSAGANTNLAVRASDHDPVLVGLFDPGAKGHLTITPTSLGFANQLVGSTSTSKTVTLGNDGVAALKVTVLSAAAAPFARTAGGATDCGSTPITIAVGGSCTLTYTFAPTTAGNANQTLTVTANDSTGGGTIALSGTGIQGHLTISPLSVSFGNHAVGTISAEHTVTLANTGSASLDVTALDAASGVFARTATGTCMQTLPITLAAGASCTLTYTFAPTSAGVANQSIAVTADVPGSGTITLEGTGTQGHLTITPDSLDFGNQIVGTTSAEQTVTLGNDGSGSLDVTTLIAPSAPFARTATGTCPAVTPITLAVGASCTLTYTFAPTAAGVTNQTLTVTTDAPGSGSIALSGTGLQGNLTITPASIDFGSQLVGTTSSQRIVTLRNTGTASLDATVDAATAPFARAGGTCAASGTINVAPASNCTLIYTFTPTATGSANQSLTVTANTPGSGQIALSGTGTPQLADVSVIIGDGVDYVSVGDTVTYTIVVRNTSGPVNATATVSDMLPANLDNGAWSCVGSGGATCGAGATSNALSDVANLPVGGSVTYTYTATVLAEDVGYVLNTATATVNGSVTDPNTANNTASDTDTLVIYRDGFEGQ